MHKRINNTNNKNYNRLYNTVNNIMVPLTYWLYSYRVLLRYQFDKGDVLVKKERPHNYELETGTKVAVALSNNMGQIIHEEQVKKDQDQNEDN
jgi:hypothetical protein